MSSSPEAMSSAAGALRRLHFDQLEHARELSILLYTRDRSMHGLAKKLKAVFNRIYISGEIKDSQKIINKFSHDVTEPKQLIDVILVDFDQSGLKMVDFVNRRVHNPDYRNCPVIPVVVLANEVNKPQDILDHVQGCGGAHKVIAYPYSPQEVVFGVMEAAYMLRSVEHTFRDLQRATVAKAKLPYLPVFDAKSAAKINVVDGEIQKVSVATSMSTLDNNNKVEEIDDCGSQCDDVLPDYLQSYRRKPKEKVDPYDFSSHGYGSELRKVTSQPSGTTTRSNVKSSKPPTSKGANQSVTIVEPSMEGGHPNKIEGGASILEAGGDSQLLPGSATEGIFGNSVSFGALLPMDGQSVTSKSTNGVQVDSKSYAETLLGDDSTEQDGTRYLFPDRDIGGGNSIAGGGGGDDGGEEGGDREAEEEARDALQRLVLTRQEDTNGLPPLQRLLDKSLRPFWSGALSTMRGVDEHIIAKARKRTDMEHDISNFVNRPRPKTATSLTVSGLNKRQMEGYWKQLRSSYSGQKEHRHSSAEGMTGMMESSRPSSASATRQQSQANSASSTPSHHGGKRPKTASSDHTTSAVSTPASHKATTTTTTTTPGGSVSKVRAKANDLHRRAVLATTTTATTPAQEAKDTAGSSNNHSRTSSPDIVYFTEEEEAAANDPWAAPGHTTTPSTLRLSRRQRPADIDTLLSSSVDFASAINDAAASLTSNNNASSTNNGNNNNNNNSNNANWNTNTMHELMTREYQASMRAERKIAMLAKEVPPDFHVSNLLDVHLTKRRINLGEKGMLEKGLALEKDGDFESASICYSRAGAHSKDPQISRMLLGNLHYRANHLMMALRCYNTAIEIVENRMAGLRVIDDEFLGYHNRAVINFRLGNDAQGLADLQKAVKVNPNHLPARELLSLVKRRMGMYSEAMEDAHVVKVQRLEEERLKREQLEKAKKQRAQKVKYNHEGKVIIHGRQRAGGVVATTAHANHRQENQQQTMLLVQQQQQQMLEARQTRERDREAALRGIEVDVPEPSCLSSLRERIAAHRSSSANDLMSGEDGGAAAGGFLRLFKMTQGMKNELFDEIFIKPTELQVSLLREPHLRSPQDIDIISTSGLGVFPFLRNLHPSILNELSAVVEYRAVSSGGLESVLFKQNQESPGVCFLLTGCVHGTMETGHVSALHGVDVVKLQERSTFGHFDLLFRSPRTSFLKSLEEVLVTVRSNITDRLRPSEHHHDDHGGTNTLSHHGGGGGGGGGGGAQVLTLNHHHHTQASNATHSHRTSVDHSTSSGSNLMNATMLMMLNQEGGHTNPSSKHHTIQSSMSPAQQLHLLEQQRVQHEHLQKEKTDFHQLFYHGVDHATGKLTNRGVQPGMFMSYTMSGPCELLMISERDFYRILYDPTVKALQQRIQTLRSCGIFKGWKHEDILRLARMSQLFTFTRGQTILAQATRPDYLYIIQKGLCKVMKRPNRTEMLMQKLQIAKDKAARIDFKYVFHHGVYNPNDDTWEPLRDLSTPLFAAPTGPTPEELAAAEIAAASAISLPLDHQGSSNNNTNSNGGVLPRVGSAMSVSASLAAAALGGGGGGGGGAVMGTGPAAHSASQIMNLNGGGIGIGGGGGGGNNGRPRTAASRVSSVGGDPTPRDLHHSHSHPHLHRASSNMTTVSALTNVSGTSKGGHHHHHHHHGQQHGHQAMGEQHHHLQDVSALMHPHDARPFSPNHAQFHPDTPSHHGQHDGRSVGGGGGARSPGGPSSTSVAGSTNGRASTAPTNGKRRMSNAVSINSLAARRASQAQAHGGLPNGRFKGFRSIEEMRAFPTSDVPPPTALTIHEEERQELAREIARLEALIKVAREQDAIDQRNHESQDKADAMRLKRSESFYSVASNHTNMTGKSGGDLWSTGENSSRDSNVPIEQVLASQLNRKQAEIKLLQWPMIFGESCVLQPEDGVSRGSIVADTTVECIVLHRMQLQTFAVDDNFLDRVRDKAVVYPGDPDIVVDLFRKQNWQQYKSEVMQDISKSRWPKRLDDLEAFVV